MRRNNRPGSPGSSGRLGSWVDGSRLPASSSQKTFRDHAQSCTARARWRALPIPARDALAVGIGSFLVFQPALAQAGATIGDLATRSRDLLGYLISAGLWLPLAARRWRPALTLIVVAVAFAAHELLAYPPTLATVGLYFAIYSAAAHQQTGRRLLIAAATAGYLLLVGLLVDQDSPTSTAGFAAFYLFLAACWAAGAWVRGRQISEETRRRLSVEAATSEERARIARELHDVVTHHVTAMVIQADAAQFASADGPPALKAGLGAISDTGRRALADLRHLLDVLSAPSASAPSASAASASAADDPLRPEQAQRTPAVGRIDDLVEQTRLAGQPIDLIEDGTPPTTAGGPEMAAYRVVQEALTNAIKHAPGRPTTVRIHYGHDATEIDVVTARPAPGDPSQGVLVSGGRGLTGMKERIDVFGGEFQAGPTPDGGFRVQASVPGERP